MVSRLGFRRKIRDFFGKPQDIVSFFPSNPKKNAGADTPALFYGQADRYHVRPFRITPLRLRRHP
jgi:hypothetical protein